jgi:hypothetical protein
MCCFLFLRFLYGIARHLRLAVNARVRIPHPKIGELAHQAKGEGIFALCAKFPYRNTVTMCFFSFCRFRSRNRYGVCDASQTLGLAYAAKAVRELAYKRLSVRIFALCAKFPFPLHP